MLLGRAGLDDPRVVSFLQAVLTDGAEPGAVRIEALNRLRAVPLTAEERVRVAWAVLSALLSGDSDGEFRLHAAVTLGDFTDTSGVIAALGALALDAEAPLELRYNAFISLQRAGATAECRALLEALRGDETLGPAARAVLAAWGAP